MMEIQDCFRHQVVEIYLLTILTMKKTFCIWGHSHAQFEIRTGKIIDRRQIFLTTCLGSIMNRTSFKILMISIQSPILPQNPHLHRCPHLPRSLHFSWSPPPPLPLISLSQGLTASQLPPSTAPITRTSRGVARKKTFQQERLDSQLAS